MQISERIPQIVMLSRNRPMPRAGIIRPIKIATGTYKKHRSPQTNDTFDFVLMLSFAGISGLP